MTVLAERTIEVTPLGLRGRYSLQTRQQLRLYQAIVEHFDLYGTAPAYTDLEASSGMNRARIFDRLRVLENCRWIEIKRDHRGRMQPFGICLIEPVLRDLKPAA